MAMAEGQRQWDEADTWLWRVSCVVQVHQAWCFLAAEDYEALRIGTEEGSRTRQRQDHALKASNCWTSVRVIVGQQDPRAFMDSGELPE
jgi:hypothetical protein